MRANFVDLLVRHRSRPSAIAAFNVYTIHQAAGVIDGALELRAPVILQVSATAAGDLLLSFIAALRRMRDDAEVPIAIILDHATDLRIVESAIAEGVDGVMVDGSSRSLEDNREMVAVARDLARGTVGLEAELGRLSGVEDGMREPTGHLTDPRDVRAFVLGTRVDALAISIGNVHGASPTAPTLDLDRLSAIQRLSPVPLVLHGASGLSDEALRGAIEHGVAKVNFNTEIRTVYRQSLLHDDELAMTLRGARRSVAEASARLIARCLGAS